MSAVWLLASSPQVSNMFFKVLALVAVVAVAVANAGILEGGYGEQDYGAHQIGAEDHHEGHHHEEQHEEFQYSHPKYEFKYSIEDPKTGDYKSQHEHRDGDKVQGEYSFLDSDGSFRKVQYTADKHSGFHAIVTKDGHLLHPHQQQQQSHY